MKRSDFLWLLLVGLFVVAWQVNYLGRPGKPADAPSLWPGSLPLGPGGTLMVFLHPQCPCSRATLGQLALALREAGTPDLATYLIFLQPAGVGADFYRSSSWDLARTMAGVAPVVDENGRLSQKFGAATSGQALFYDASGRLVFAGGLTATRGHEGPSLGLDALLSALREQKTHSPTPVYGCPLREQTCSP